MELRDVVVALGASIGTFLVVAVAVIEGLPVAFSAIIGLPVGLLAGIVVLIVLFLVTEDWPLWMETLGTGLAGFGYAIIVGLAVRYVDLAGLRSSLPVRWLVVIGLLVGGMAGLAVVLERT